MPKTKWTPFTERWELVDRRIERALKSAITETISAEEYPYEVRVPSPPSALGATGMLITFDPDELKPFRRACLTVAAPELYASTKELHNAAAAMLRVFYVLGGPAIDMLEEELSRSGVELEFGKRAEEALAKARGEL